MMKLRGFIAKILGKVFAVETLIIALQQCKCVVRVDILMDRDLDDMSDYFTKSRTNEWFKPGVKPEAPPARDHDDFELH